MREGPMTGLEIGCEQCFQNEDNSKTIRRRLRLIFCLIPILIIWYYLIAKVPITNHVRGTTGFWASQLRRTVTLHCSSHSSGWQQYIIFDTTSGRIHVEKNATLARNGVSWPVFVKELKRDGEAIKRWRLWSVEQGADRIASILEFDFPSAGHPRIVGQRFAVHIQAESILVLDLYSANAKATAYPTSHASNGFARPIGNTKRFVVANRIPSPPKSTSLQVAIELFEIDDAGVPNLVNTWNAFRGISDSSSLCVTELNGQFISIHPTDGNFEIRSAVDGSLIETQPLPADFNSATDKWHLDRDALFVNSGSLTYSLRDNRWLKVPIGFKSYFADSPDHKLRLWLIGDNSKQVVTDCDSEDEISRIEPIGIGAFLGDEELVFESVQWGHTFRTVEARTGRTIKTWRPYWWVFPALLFSLPAYIIWSISWLRSATVSDRCPWADIAWTSSFPILALVLRVTLVGDTLDIERDPVFILEGLFCALIFVACAWICNSREWIVRKLLPLMLVLASLGTILSLVFTSKLSIATPIILSAFFFTAASIAVCLLLRLLGFHLSHPSQMLDSQKASLRDLFVLVFVSAALFTPLRLIIPDPTAIDLSLFKWSHLFLLTLAPSLAWTTSIIKNRYLHGFGKWLSLSLFAYLVFDVLYYFVSGSWLFRFQNGLDGFVLAFLTAFVSTFILSKAFRRRGWQFRILFATPPEKKWCPQMLSRAIVLQRDNGAHTMLDDSTRRTDFLIGQ